MKRLTLAVAGLLAIALCSADAAASFATQDNTVIVSAGTELGTDLGATLSGELVAERDLVAAHAGSSLHAASVKLPVPVQLKPVQRVPVRAALPAEAGEGWRPHDVPLRL